MLASFLLRLRPRQVAVVGRTVGRSLHAVFLALIRSADPALAERLHASTQVKPFTVSQLQGRFQRRDGRPYALPDMVYEVRYTVLAEAMFQVLARILVDQQANREPVVLNGHTYDLLDIVVDPDHSDGWADITRYEDLVASARPETRIELEFTTPTAFRQGKMNLLFPLPSNVFGSYLQRWQAHSPIALDDEGLLDFIREYVVAERYTLETRVIPYDDAQYNGFVGTCAYRVLSDDAGHLKTLNTLAAYSLFSGTGLKTTQGMGQTRRID